MKILLVLTVLALLFGLIPFAIWRVLRKHHKVDVGPREVAASARVATAAARTWMLQTEVGEHGPFGLPQLQWFKDEGLLTETSCLRDPATGALRQAGEMPELFRSVQPPREFRDHPVQFQTFVGHRDPVRHGNGLVRISGDALVLVGRRRRLFAWGKEEEPVPLQSIHDVVVDGRIVRFSQDGKALRQPRLVRLATPEAANQLAAALPTRMSPAGAQQKADAEAFARFMAGGRPWVTRSIIAANLAVYAWVVIRGGGWIQVDPVILGQFGGNLGPITAQGQWWRLVTATFLHAGLVHIAVNMWVLWEAGRVSERLFGHGRFLALYLATGTLASIASINWHQDVVSVGASGAIFGIYGALLAALVLRQHLLPITVTARLRNGAIAFVVYAVLQSLGQSGIDHAAHFGGLFSGILLGAGLVLPRARAWVAVAVSIALTVVGVLRAAEVNAPFTDEGSFRSFLAEMPKEESRLNDLIRRLQPEMDKLGAAELAQRFDRDLIPGWKSLSDQLDSMSKLLPRSKQLRDPLAQYVRLKYESLAMFRDSLLTDDKLLADLAGQRMLEANRHAEIVTQTISALASRKGNSVPAQGRPTTTAPPQPTVANEATTRKIASGQWQDAGRDVFREACATFPRGADIVKDQALAGYVEDALQRLPALKPDAQSWVLFHTAREVTGLERPRRLALMQQAADAVRVETLPANLKSDALTRAAMGFLEFGDREQALGLMREALQAAMKGASDDRGPALRALPDGLDAAATTGVTALVPVAEEAARTAGDPFHQAMAHASLAHLWHRLGDSTRAWQWWRDGMAMVPRIPERSSVVTAEGRFAKVGARMGDRRLADEMIATRRGSFIDLTIREVMLIAAEQKDFDQVWRDYSAIRGGCAASSSVAGFALRDLVDLQVKQGDLDAAYKTMDRLAACSARFVGEAWLIIAEAELKGNRNSAAKEAVSRALVPVQSLTPRPLDMFELLVMVHAAGTLSRIGDTDQAKLLANKAIAQAGRMPVRRTDDKVTVLAKATLALLDTGENAKATEAITQAYQLAVTFPKDTAFPEIGKARALATVAATLAEMGGK